VVTPKLLDAPTAERLGMDVDQARAHRARLRAIPGLAGKLQALYGNRELPEITDPDRMLYSGGFFSDSDRRSMDRVHAATPESLATESFVFEDPRLPEMLFRYRARNFPDSLNDAERAQWEEQRFQYLTDPEAGASITLDDFHTEIEQLSQTAPPEDQAVLDALLEYGDSLLA
jgi:exodeoxyribonuclease-1